MPGRARTHVRERTAAHVGAIASTSGGGCSIGPV